MRATILFLFALATISADAQNISKRLRVNGTNLEFDTTGSATFAVIPTRGWVQQYVAIYGGGGGTPTAYTSSNGITLNTGNFTLGGALSNHTTITGAFNLNFGAVGSRLGQVNAYTSNGILLQDGPVSGTFPALTLATGNASLYGRNTFITGLTGLSLTSGGSNALIGATVEITGADSLKFSGTIPTSTDTTAKPVWLTASGRAVKGNHGNWVTSVFGRTGAVTAQTGDYSSFYPSLLGSYANPSWITSLASSKITWAGTTSQYILGDGSLATKITNNNQLTNGAGYLTNITGKITQGTNVAITGSGTTGDPYVINASGGTGSTYSFTNGLTEAGSVAKLGGRLSQNTTVSAANLYQIAFDSTTKFGIGLASPNAKLHVKGVAGSDPRGSNVGLLVEQPDDGSQAIGIMNDANPLTYTNMYQGTGGDFWIENHDLNLNRNVELNWDATSNMFEVHVEDNGYIGLDANNTGYVHVQGRLGMKTLNPTAIVHLPAGTATASTAPLKFTTGTALTTPEDGAMEYHTGHLYFTVGSTRYQLDQQGGGGGSVGTWQQVTDLGSTTTNLLIANGTLGSGTTYDNTPYSNNPLMLWYPRKAAFRAGGSSSFWRTDSIGNYSVAFGNSTKAKGAYSFASGNGAIATGQYSFAAGNGARATGSSAVSLSQNGIAAGTTSFLAGGQNYEIAANTIGAVSVGTDGFTFGGPGDGGNYSFVSGDANTTFGYASLTGGFGNVNYGNYGFVMGNDNVLGNTSNSWDSTKANNYQSGAIFGTQNRSFTGSWHFIAGRAVQTSAASNIIAFGSGVDATNTRMAASEASSFNVGFNSTVPTFVVHAASGAGTYGLTEAYGALKVGTTSTLSNGTVRYTGTDFEGAVGGNWISLTTPTVANLPTSIVYNNQANTFNNNTIEGYSAKYNDQTGTTYTVLSGDNGKILTFNNASAVTVTIPSGLPVGFNCMILQKGAGQVTLSASSTTINNRQSYSKTAGQYAMATLVSISSNVFVSGGDMQ